MYDYSFSSVLEMLVNVDLLPRYIDNSKCLQISSYDRKGGNDDGFNGTYSFLRRNPDSTLVIFESKGKGVIERIWTPTPTTDTLDFYLGDPDKISFSISFLDLFSGNEYPFIHPLCGNELGGYYCYIPIPYDEGCKIVFRGKQIRFLQIQYRELSNSVDLKKFSINLNNDEKELLSDVASVWNFERPVKFNDSEFVVSENVLKPGEIIEIFNTENGGRITGIEIKNPEYFEGNNKNIDIRITYDNEPYPAIFLPLVDFFGYGFGKKAMRSIVSGTNEKVNYCYLPMPFDQCAKIELISRDSNKVFRISSKVFFSHEKRNKKEEGKLYVQWNRLQESVEGESMIMAEVTGKGHYIGSIVETQNLKPGMTLFFEGDDIAYIDGVNTIHGTGSEDYFNGGWYAFLDNWDRGISLPIHGSLDYSLVYGRTGGYRWHLSDKISFDKNFLYVMEHGPEGNKELVSNTTIGFYYSDSPKSVYSKPRNELTEVYIPRVFMYYPQMMDINVWKNINIRTEWCYPTGGFTYDYKITDESKLRISIKEIPDGYYKLYLDLNESTEGCEVSIWQRNNQISDIINTYGITKSRIEKFYVTDIFKDDQQSTLTFTFRVDGDERNSFSLNRLILERNK